MIEILSVSFLRTALIGAAVAAVSTAVLSVFIALKRVSYMSDSFAHISFAGIAVGLYIGMNYSIAAALFVALMAVIISYLSKRYRIDQSNTTTVFLSVSMAVGILFIHLNRNVNVDITSLLFGNILLITKSDIFILLALFAVNLLFITLMFREMVYYAYNSEIAAVFKVPVSLVGFIFILLVAMNVVFAVKVSGVVMITAMMIFPGLTALNIVRNIAGAIVLSEIISLFASVSGFFLSYYMNIPTGAMIILMMFMIFIISLPFRGIRKVS